jgi:hypothetical protein
MPKNVARRRSAAAPPPVKEEAVLASLPGYITSMFQEIGFAKWNKDHLPVLFLNPFFVSSGTVRRDWESYYERFRTGKVKKMAHLVYWYGATNPSEMFSMMGPNTVVTYEEAKKKGLNTTPQRIIKKMEKGKALTQTEDMIFFGLKDLEADLLAPKESRWEREVPPEPAPTSAPKKVASAPRQSTSPLPPPESLEAEINKDLELARSLPDVEGSEREITGSPIPPKKKKTKKKKEKGDKKREVSRMREKKGSGGVQEEDAAGGGGGVGVKEEAVAVAAVSVASEEAPAPKRKKIDGAVAAVSVAPEEAPAPKRKKIDGAVSAVSVASEGAPAPKRKKIKKEATAADLEQVKAETAYALEEEVPSDHEAEKGDDDFEVGDTEMDNAKEAEAEHLEEFVPGSDPAVKASPKIKKSTKIKKEPTEASDQKDMEDTKVSVDPAHEAKLARRREKDRLKRVHQKSQEAFEENEKELLPLMYKLQRAAFTSFEELNRPKIMRVLGRIEDFAPTIVPSFIKEHKLGMLLKEVRKHLQKQEQQQVGDKSSTTEIADKIKALGAVLKKNYHEKLPLVPIDFEVKVTTPFVLSTPASISKLPQAPPEPALKNGRGNAVKKEPPASTRLSLDSSVGTKEIGQEKSRPGAAGPPNSAPHKKKAFSLGAMIGGGVGNASQQTSKTASKVPLLSSEAKPDQRKGLPDWLWSAPNKNPPSEEYRCLALEWIQLALESMPPQAWSRIRKATPSGRQVDSDDIAINLEDAVHVWSESPKESGNKLLKSKLASNPFLKKREDLYWAKMHEIIGGLIGRAISPNEADNVEQQQKKPTQLTDLARKVFLQGIYKKAMDFVLLPTLTFYNSMEGN